MDDVRLIDANALAKDIHSSYSDDLGILEHIDSAPTIDANPVKPMEDKPHWTDTDETVWEARDKDSGQEFEISIVSAKCSICGRWAEQVNAFPPYMHYEYCPHCSRKMEVNR